MCTCSQTMDIMYYYITYYVLNNPYTSFKTRSPITPYLLVLLKKNLTLPIIMLVCFFPPTSGALLCCNNILSGLPVAQCQILHLHRQRFGAMSVYILFYKLWNIMLPGILMSHIQEALLSNIYREICIQTWKVESNDSLNM